MPSKRPQGGVCLCPYARRIRCHGSAAELSRVQRSAISAQVLAAVPAEPEDLQEWLRYYRATNPEEPYQMLEIPGASRLLRQRLLTTMRGQRSGWSFTQVRERLLRAKQRKAAISKSARDAAQRARRVLRGLAPSDP